MNQKHSKAGSFLRNLFLVFGFAILGVVFLLLLHYSERSDVRLVGQTIRRINETWTDVDMFYRTNELFKSPHAIAGFKQAKASLKSVGPYEGRISIRRMDDGAQNVHVYISYQTPIHKEFRNKTAFPSGPICNESYLTIQRFVGLNWMSVVNEFGLPDYIEKSTDSSVLLWFHSDHGDFLFEVENERVLIATLAT